MFPAWFLDIGCRMQFLLVMHRLYGGFSVWVEWSQCCATGHSLKNFLVCFLALVSPKEFSVLFGEVSQRLGDLCICISVLH